MTEIADIPPTDADSTPAEPSGDPRPLPMWVSVIIILLCLGGGGGVVWWYVHSDVPSRTPIILNTKPGVTAGRGPRFNAPPPQDVPIQSTGQNTWYVHTAEANIQVSKDAKGEPVLRLNYNRRDIVPQDQLETILAARRIIRDNAVSTLLKTTPEQLQKLRQLSPQIGIQADAADHQKLKDLWKAYEAAQNKSDAQTKLLAGLDEVARKWLPATRAFATDRATKIKATLTPEQWKAFADMGK